MTPFATKLGKNCCIALAMTVLPFGALAANTVISSEWLSDRINDPTLVLLHVGEKKTYNKGHIPGAQRVDAHMDLSDPSSHSDDSLILELPSVARLTTTLEKWGISDDSTIVVYWSDDQVTPATRALFTLDWAGLGDQTFYLDGGLDAWKAADHEVASATMSPPRGSLTLSPRTELIVDAEWIQEHANEAGIALLDGRSRAFYDGVSKDRGKAGHIPGAASTPWTELVDRQLRLNDLISLRQSFDEAGVEPGDVVVAYCHIGQYATAVLLAARTLGHEVRLYDGAFQDWADRDLPVVSAN